MRFAEILTLPEGVGRTAQLVAWVQALFGEDALAALQALSRRTGRRRPSGGEIEAWAQKGP
jgi:hypothetical protein